MMPNNIKKPFSRLPQNLSSKNLRTPTPLRKNDHASAGPRLHNRSSFNALSQRQPQNLISIRDKYAPLLPVKQTSITEQQKPLNKVLRLTSQLTEVQVQHTVPSPMSLQSPLVRNIFEKSLEEESFFLRLTFNYTGNFTYSLINTATTIPTNPLSLNKETFQEYQNPERSFFSDAEKKHIFALNKHKLIDSKNLDEKLTRPFYDLLSAKKEKECLTIFKENNNKFPIKLGLLKITSEKDTIFLSGVQNHIIIYSVICRKTDRNLVWGYLTSTKPLDKNQEALSQNQPFNFDEIIEKKKPQKNQHINLLKKPLMTKNEFIKNLNKNSLIYETEKLKIYANQHQIGVDYLQSHKISERLQNEFNTKILAFKEEKSFNIYRGIGVSAEDINFVVKTTESNVELNIKAMIDKYKNMKNQCNDYHIDKWLKKAKITMSEYAYNRFLEVLENEN